MTIAVILLYASFAVVDVFDKFLISKRKIQPLPYTFFTVVTGGLILLLWPWVYQPLEARFIFWNLLSGAYYGLVMYVFFKVLARGEVSRVVPFVFGLVPMFDLLISAATGRSVLSSWELPAMALLIPGALIIGYHEGRYLHKYLGLTVLSAFLYSSYNFLWQYGAQTGNPLNNMMWNRLGAAGVLLLLFVLPSVRIQVLSVREVKQKAHTSFLFLLKQGLGGFNFILLSYFLAVGKVPVVDGLSGFRYVFLFFLSLLLSHKFKHILEEEISKQVLWQKTVGITLIFLGTIFLFFH